MGRSDMNQLFIVPYSSWKFGHEQATSSEHLEQLLEIATDILIDGQGRPKQDRGYGTDRTPRTRRPKQDRGYGPDRTPRARRYGNGGNNSMALTTPGGTSIVINWAVKHDRMCTTFREHGVCRKREKNQECLYPEDRHLPNDDTVCTDDQYKKVGVCKNYLTCPHKHPWDDKWGKKHEVYLKAKMLPAPAGTSAPVVPFYLVCPAIENISQVEQEGAINGVLTGETAPTVEIGRDLQTTDGAMHSDQVEVTADQGSHVNTNDNMGNDMAGASQRHGWSQQQPRHHQRSTSEATHCTQGVCT